MMEDAIRALEDFLYFEYEFNATLTGGLVGGAYRIVNELYENHKAKTDSRGQSDKTCSLSPYETQAGYVADMAGGVGTGRIPYGDSLFDVFYIVKFSMACAIQGASLYRKALDYLQREESENTQKIINIVSFGAGNFIDYWSLEYAMAHGNGEELSRIKYTAYEIEDWGRQSRSDIVGEYHGRIDAAKLKCVAIDKNNHREGNLIYRISRERTTFYVGEEGDFWQASPEFEDGPVIILFPNSFHEIVENGVPDNAGKSKEHFAERMKKIFADVIPGNRILIGVIFPEKSDYGTTDIDMREIMTAIGAGELFRYGRDTMEKAGSRISREKMGLERSGFIFDDKPDIFIKVGEYRKWNHPDKNSPEPDVFHTMVRDEMNYGIYEYKKESSFAL